MNPNVRYRDRSAPREVDELVRQYADSDRSDTFVSYHDAIVLAQEVRRLRRRVASWRRKDRKHVEVWATATGRRIDVFVWPVPVPRVDDVAED